MAILTGSGRIHRDEGPSNSRSAGGEVKETKSSTNYALANTDSLRGKIITNNVKDKDRETPPMETRVSSSPVQNHEGLVFRSPLSKGNSVRAEKKRPRIPLVRTEGDSSSSVLKKFMAVTTSSHKKRLTARSYRALLSQNAKITENLDAGRIFQKITNGEGEGIEADCLQQDDSEMLELTKSTSNGATSSSYPENRFSSQCSVCFKLQSEDNDSQLQEFCSCNAKAGEDLATFSENLGGVGTKDNRCSAGGNLTFTHLKDSSEAIQRESDHTVCVVCKHPGILLRCGGKGCKAGYHLACVDPPLSDVPPGLWLCFCCLRKKMEFGVYSVSEGMESVWDSKEETQKEKHYLVKYKGLAHFYNLWIPESQLLREDPMLLAKFNKKHRKEQVKGWKHEWTKPHLLLQKRFLMPPEQNNECSCGHGDNFEYCYLEWFVKWKGLGYEHATWEFENSSLLCSVEGKGLVNDYERRREEAKKASDPARADKAVCLKEDLFHKLPRLPDGYPSELENDHLESIGRILLCWRKNQNAVLIDDQERIMKSILFILNLLPYTCRPLLIISTISSISIWEAEFARLAPSIDVVVYNGNKNVRKMIRSLEFYEEGGCIMFKVLLACPNIIVEDFEAFDCIGWEATIIDDCQKSGVSKHFEQFTNLSSEFKLLLINSPPKDNIVDYLNLLSFLDPRGQENRVNSLKFDSINRKDALSILKERLTQYIVYKGKRNSSIFVEYWVPVQLSEVQIKQYCSILASNSQLLRSRIRANCVEPLLDVLVSIRKCCNHPYLADDSLQHSLIKTLPVVEHLDVGVNASGKLQLLDKILQEMKNRVLRVLVLFQSSVGSGRNHMGDILYDFLHQRFGDESFVYVDSRIDISRTQAILQSFNDIGRGKFVIIIENRACRPRIKLSSVDAVVIYDSDWNPLNDLKALRKITIDSPVQQVKLFRLYSPYTVEEKVLILGKEDGGLEVDIENASIRLRHSLLSWGAAYLFSKLNEFCQSDRTNAWPKPFSDSLLLDDVLDLLSRSPENIDATGAGNCSKIVKAHPSGASYSSNISLYGEKGDLSSDGDPTLFWSKLLETSSPKLRYTSGPLPRIRRSVQCLDEFAKRPEAESCDLKNREKLGRSSSELISQETRLQCGGQEAEGSGETAVPEHMALYEKLELMKDNFASVLGVSTNIVELNSVENLLDKPRTDAEDPTHDGNFKTASSDDRDIGGRIKEYSLSSPTKERSCMKKVQKSARKENQLHVSKDPTVGSSNPASLNLQEMVEESQFAVPTKDVPRALLEEGSSKAAASVHEEPKQGESQSYVPSNGVVEELMRGGSSYTLPFDHVELEEGEIREHPNVQTCSEQSTSKELWLLKDEILKKRINLIEIVYSGRIDKLLSKQTQELTEFKNQMNQEKQKLIRTRDLDLEMISATNTDMEVSDAMKKLHQEFSNKMDQFDQHMKCQRRKLSVMQIEARNKEKQIKDQWMEEAKRGRLAKAFDMLPLSSTGFRVEKFTFREQVEAHDDSAPGNAFSLSGSSADATTRSVRSICCSISYADPATLPNEGTKHMSSGKEMSICNSKKLIAVESADQNRINFDISAANLSGGPGDELLQTRTPSSLCNISSETEAGSTESAEKNRVTFDISSTILSGVSADWLVQTKTSASQYNIGLGTAAGYTEASSEFSNTVPREEIEVLLTEKESPASQCNSVNVMESIEPSRTTSHISETVLCGGAGDKPLETEGECEIMNATCEDIVPGTSAEHHGDAEPIEPSRTSHISETVLCGEAGDKPLETEGLVSECEIMNATVEDIIPGTSAEHHGDAGPDDACLTSSLQSQTNIDSLPHASNFKGCENSALHNQIASVVEPEIHAVSGTESEPACSVAADIVIPISDSGDPEPIQVEHRNNSHGVSDPVLQQLPPSTGLTLVMPSHERGHTHAHIGSGQEPLNQLHCSAQLNGVLTPEFAVAFAETGQSNNSFSHSFALPVPSSSNIPPENMRFHHLRSSTVQPKTANYLQVLSAAPQPMPQHGPHSDPLNNEIIQLRKKEHLLAQIHVEKKRRLELECEKELEKVKKKYASLIQDDEAEFAQHMEGIKGIQSLIHMNQNLAEEFRNFLQNTRGVSAVPQGKPSSSMQQSFQLPRLEIAQRPVLGSPSMSAPSSVNLHVRSDPRQPAPHLRPFRSQRNSLLQNGQLMNPQDSLLL